MDEKEIQVTDIWELYEQSRDYCIRINMFSDTDRNYRFYNGNQWEGLKVSGIEPVQLNFIKPVVKYKVGTINSNLWAINYSSENFENKEFRSIADNTCELLNKKAAKVWEKDSMDMKVRKISKDSAINGMGVMYTTYNVEEQTPVNEIIATNDIYFGNENDGDIQRQPYILIKQRRSIAEIQELARNEGVSEDKMQYIIGDSDYFEESGEAAKIEKDNKCTLVTKFYKKNGTVWYAKATRYADIVEDTDSGLTYYPVSVFHWEEKEGSARGEGEVRYLIPTQIEVNKTAMRRIITVKQTAYPQKVANISKIQNPSALNEVGSIIKVMDGMTVEDVSKVFANVPPAQMSADVEKLQNELISTTRELAGAGDIATGEVNPESASGKAILAVQQAAQQPLVEQLGGLKVSLEDTARIWLDMFIVYSADGLTLEETVTDPATGEEVTQLVEVPQTVLQELKATVKVDITPVGAFDRYARELTLENLLKAGYFSVQRLPELEIYVKLLGDQSTAPKTELEEAIRLMKEEQQKIAMINAQAQAMQQKVNQFLNEEPDAQASQMLEMQAEADANREVQAEREAIPAERENIDEEVPTE